MKIWLVIIVLCLCNHAYSQDCPDLINPLAGSTNVAVDATISWDPVTGVTGYIISLGTTPGGTDIINQVPVGTSNSFTPPVGMPDNTLVYVTITLFFFDQPDITCPSQSFTTEDYTLAPNCTTITNPIDGETNVNVATNIDWTYVTGATGYVISLSTAPGLGDIINNLDLGNVLSYDPINDFPFDTEIFVEIIPYNENGSASGCSEVSFTTGPFAVLPICSNIIYPLDGEINVDLTPLIEWEAVSNATGYIVSIGSTPFDNDVLDAGVFTNNSTFVLNFESNSVYFIEIVPFNSAGEAIGCGQTSFSTILGCGPFFDVNTGELTTLNPVLTLPSEVGLCLNEVPTTLTAPDLADGYRWYMQDANGDYFIISESESIELTEEGQYLYEAFNLTESIEFPIECASTSEFTVVSSEIATIMGANVDEGIGSISIELFVEGNGNYEYALDDIFGPYQESNFFPNAPEDTNIVYVRDKNGCGVSQLSIENYIRPNGFPKFFTPNDDGFNDHWQFKPSNEDNFTLKTIYIYDRYGKLVKNINPASRGWNGTLNGEKLSTSGFWYKAVTISGNNLYGYFTLKR
ncbi:MAG: T9SS type B sorting domain-containing protein [Flavobacteriaceae bacterium]|nr:T9SS type B sorting domain-containing protein [Bacteroidia bacterium]NNK27246.1 T9SS type B sorting domain-containing protein [Flavobacteriaceae bacterium]NNL59920.1 T9SS type B sorting domain-containing protein [Flavobacteriaceae bacterium]RZV66253.1 MAG: T9SS type B sorting domain-containing protein [Flavobacteriaceae bacterium]